MNRSDSKLQCQFCGNFHDTREEHTEHVERMHYAELLRRAENNSAPDDLEEGP